MATVRMKKGVMYADVFDSPETIRQAQLDGYSLCEEVKKVEEKATENTEKQKEEQSETKVVHKKTTVKK